MEIITLDNGIGQLVSTGIVINNIDDGTDLVGNTYFQGLNKLIINEEQLTPSFFDLSSKLAGEILQKFSNYQIKLAIVGDFEKFKSVSLKDFILESNKTGKINFVNSTLEAIAALNR
jgi:hypothetical protein